MHFILLKYKARGREGQAGGPYLFRELMRGAVGGGVAARQEKSGVCDENVFEPAFLDDEHRRRDNGNADERPDGFVALTEKIVLHVRQLDERVLVVLHFYFIKSHMCIVLRKDKVVF